MGQRRQVLPNEANGPETLNKASTRWPRLLTTAYLGHKHVVCQESYCCSAAQCRILHGNTLDVNVNMYWYENLHSIRFAITLNDVPPPCILVGIKKMTKEEADKVCISNKNRSHTKLRCTEPGKLQMSMFIPSGASKCVQFCENLKM